MPLEVGISLLTALIIFLLTLLSKQVRQFLFYKRHEFQFDYNSNFNGCEYDIQWEELRLTFELGGVHNEYLSNVFIKKNGENPGKSYPELKVSNKFIEIAEWKLFFKLSTVVRIKSKSGVKEFQIFLS